MINLFDEKSENYINNFCNEIKLPEKAYEEVYNLYLKASKEKSLGDKIIKYAEALYKRSGVDLIRQSVKNDPKTEGLNALLAMIIASNETKALYAKHCIPDKIFYDTMSDITIWVGNFYEDTGFYGISDLGWLTNHLNLRLFRLERLQFEFSSYEEYPELEKLCDLPQSLKKGDPALSVHIPQGEKLDFEACENSYKKVKQFFPEFYPDFHFKCCVCHSWLLSPLLKDILPESSNIIKFQNKFKILYLDKESDQYKERIFGRSFESMKVYPTDTSLQKATVKYIENGGKLGGGYGVIFASDL